MLLKGHRKRPSLTQLILLTHLQAGFEKRGLTVAVIVMITAQIHWGVH